MEELLTWGRGNQYVCQIPTGEIVYLQLNSNGFFPSPDSPEPPFPVCDLKEPPATEGGKSRERDTAGLSFSLCDTYFCVPHSQCLMAAATRTEAASGVHTMPLTLGVEDAEEETRLSQ